jgi:DnaJ-domain-containing protein 1
MTLMEMSVSFMCLVGGYALVSWLMNRGQPPSASARREPPPGQQPPPRGEPPPRPDPPASAPEDWWTVLYLPANADLAAVKDAYRSLIAQYHPDKVADMGPEIRAVAEAQSARINKAYDAAKRSFRR